MPPFELAHLRKPNEKPSRDVGQHGFIPSNCPSIVSASTTSVSGIGSFASGQGNNRKLNMHRKAKPDIKDNVIVAVECKAAFVQSKAFVRANQNVQNMSRMCTVNSRRVASAGEEVATTQQLMSDFEWTRASAKARPINFKAGSMIKHPDARERGVVRWLSHRTALVQRIVLTARCAVVSFCSSGATRSTTEMTPARKSVSKT